MSTISKYLAVARGGKTIRLKAHVISRDETLLSVARMYHVPWAEVARLTHQYLGTHPDWLVDGMLVIVGEEDIS